MKTYDVVASIPQYDGIDSKYDVTYCDWKAWIRSLLVSSRYDIFDQYKMLVDCYDMMYLTDEALTSCVAMIDSVFVGYMGYSRGMQCVRAFLDCSSCVVRSSCEAYYYTHKRYSGSDDRTKNIRMCRYLLTFFGDFTEEDAKALGIHEASVFSFGSVVGG